VKAAAAHCTHHGGASVPRASGTRQNQSPVKYPCICYAHKFGCNNKEREHTDVDWKRSKLKNHRPRHAVRPSVACPRHSSIHMHSRLGNNSESVSLRLQFARVTRLPPPSLSHSCHRQFARVLRCYCTWFFYATGLSAAMQFCFRITLITAFGWNHS
jgi:hypothetical protein